MRLAGVRRMTVLIAIVSATNWAFAAATETCVACHGEAGISSNSVWPNIGGQKREYLVLQLKAFKTGKRTDVLMSPIAKMLSDSEIEELAEYYANLKGAQ